MLCITARSTSAQPSATALLPHHATYIPVLYTRHVPSHIYTTTQIVHEAPLYVRGRHTTARPLHTTHASCTQIHSLLCPMTTTQDAGVGGWSFAISRGSCIPDVAALFRWPGVSPDPGPSPATGEKPGWAAATYNLPFPLEAPVNPGPVTPPSLPPLQGFLHIRVSNSVLYLLGGPGADSTLTTTLTPTELGPTQANPGTPHQGVHPRHAPATYSDSSSARGPPGARRVKGLVGARWLRVWNPLADRETNRHTHTNRQTDAQTHRHIDQHRQTD